MWVEVAEIDHSVLLDGNSHGDTSDVIAERVLHTRELQHGRYKKEKTNSELTAKDIKSGVMLTEAAKILLERSAKKIGLSPRAFHRVIKLARTIADMDHYESIEEKHILEALQYRPKAMD